MLLEICANSYQSAKNAQIAGAKRIELCSELAVGGVTPSYGLLKQTVENTSLQVFVLVRPRSGNFAYSEAEFAQIKYDIEICKELGCHGIVSGVLNTDNTIDIERTKELVELSKPLPFTFHRAFDCVPNPQKALDELIDLGIERVLTSGQQSSAAKGVELLKKLKEQGKNKIIILAGGGINANNATLFKDAGFTEIHASASTFIKSKVHPSVFDVKLTVSDTEKIKEILNKL